MIISFQILLNPLVGWVHIYPKVQLYFQKKVNPTLKKKLL